jgi:GNAT superfamily N-acetyltransferase
MMAGVIELRVLTPDDWADWRALRLVALADAPDAFGGKLADWQGEGDREERWRGRLSLPQSHNLLAMLDGRPVGMASGAPGETDGVAELLSMYVDSAARGQGVGDLLIGEVERWARDVFGASTLELAVSEGNAPAVAFYQRHGFQDTGRVGDMPDGRPERIMTKRLS